MIDPTRLYRLEEAAVLAGIAYTSLYTAVRKGAVIAAKYDGIWKIAGSDLISWSIATVDQSRGAKWRPLSAALASVALPESEVTDAIAQGLIETRSYAGQLQVNSESLAQWRAERSGQPGSNDAARQRLRMAIAERAAVLRNDQIELLIRRIEEMSDAPAGVLMSRALV